MTSRRTVRFWLALCCVTFALAGCGTFGSTPPSISMPRWFSGDSHKPGPLPEITASVTPRLAWQAQVGKAAQGLAPGVAGDAGAPPPRTAR